MTAYQCKFCHHFHFGHPPARVRQSLAAIRKRVVPNFSRPAYRPLPQLLVR
jgi:hypothetical protein